MKKSRTRMTIFHGSTMRLPKPWLGGGKPYNDYGHGFYCTESRELAMEWAVRSDCDGFANCYELNIAGLNALNLVDPQYTMLHWLAVLLKYREFEVAEGLPAAAKAYILKNFLINPEAFDLVIGYRADDSYFSFAQDFLNNTISYSQLCAAMRLGKLGEQIALKSERAFAALKFVGAERAAREDWLARKLRRDESARTEYRKSVRIAFVPGEIRVVDIVSERIKPDDSRLQ